MVLAQMYMTYSSSLFDDGSRGGDTTSYYRSTLA